MNNQQNNQQNKTNRKTKKPYPLFTYFCLLLSVAAMCTGATFAKYATRSQGDAGVGVVPLVCSFSVDEISSTTFSNSDYWLNIDNQHQAQNHPREIIFSVHNYEKNADGTNSAPSELDLQSTFRFYAPKEFLENVAFQILQRGDGNTRTPLTQQYVLPTIVNSTLEGKTNINTSDFTMEMGSEIEPADYGEYGGRPEEELTLNNQGFNATEGTGKIVAIAQTGNVEVATIALTAEKRKNVEYKITQVRGNVVSSVNDMTAPEYYSVHQAGEMVFYCLDITLPSMILQSERNEDGTVKPADGQFIFAFTIIEKDVFTDPTDKNISEHFNVKGVSLYSDAACTTLSKVAVVNVYNTLEDSGKITSSKYSLVGDNTETELVLEGNTVKLNDGKNTMYYVKDDVTKYLNNYKWNPLAENPPTSEADLPYEIGGIVKKVFPTDVRVLFTQASQTGGN